ncbi:MAG: DUF4258 domain-containing protein [Calditrichaceae bacterium]|nr:DUF4258 domain-containing protein [Calditrichia bacterium]NUQ43920.1 DUF4258 domain-containing protein [Calditrichaceae bacterium]
MADIIFTQHALQRMSQRGFHRTDVFLALAIGKKIYAEGTLFVFLGKRCLTGFGNLAERLEGLTLVMEPKTNTLLTVYRNRRRPENIRHKERRFRRFTMKYKLLN